MDLRIYNFIDESISDQLDKSLPPPPPTAIAALKNRNKIRTKSRGDLIKIEYFERTELSPLSGSKSGINLVAREDRIYVHGSFGPVRKDTSITYILADGSEGPVVTLDPVFYDTEESRTAGRRRRRNVVDSMTINAIGMLVSTQTLGDVDAASNLGKAYLSSIAGQVSLYIESGDDLLASTIQSDVVATWLDNIVDADTGATIRHYIMGELA